MNPAEQIFICQHLDHVNEPITGFCLNLVCMEKPQCCTQCLINQHLDHKGDCKTIIQLKFLFQKDIAEIPNMKQENNQTFENVDKDQLSLIKLLVNERNKLLELEKKLKQPKFYLYNKDFIRLKWLYETIMNLSGTHHSFFLDTLQAMIRIQQTINEYGEYDDSKIKKHFEFKQQIADLEQEFLVISKANIFNQQIEAYCEQKNCSDAQQCCNSCVILQSDQQILIFEIITTIINSQCKIINQWLQTVENIFLSAQQLFFIVKKALETYEFYLKEMWFFLETQDFYQFMLKLRQIKTWLKLKQVYLEKKNEIKISDMLGNLILLFQTNMQEEKETVEDIILNKQIFKGHVKKSQINLETNLKFWEMFQHGNALFQLERYQEANQSYNQAIKLNPNQSEGWLRKGNTLRILNRYQDAIACFDRAIQLNPIYYDAFNDKGDLLYELKCYEDAIKCYDQAIEQNPNRSDAFNSKGLALYYLEKFEDSNSCLEKAIKINPGRFDFFNNQGNALRHLDRYDDAVLAYKKSISLNPKNTLPLKNLSIALFKLNRFVETMFRCDQILNLDPSHECALKLKNLAFKKWEEKRQQKSE